MSTEKFDFPNSKNCDKKSVALNEVMLLEASMNDFSPTTRTRMRNFLLVWLCQAVKISSRWRTSQEPFLACDCVLILRCTRRPFLAVTTRCHVQKCSMLSRSIALQWEARGSPCKRLFGLSKWFKTIQCIKRIILRLATTVWRLCNVGVESYSSAIIWICWVSCSPKKAFSLNLNCRSKDPVFETCSESIYMRTLAKTFRSMLISQVGHMPSSKSFTFALRSGF